MLNDDLIHTILALPQQYRLELIDRIEQSIELVEPHFTPYIPILERFDRKRFGFPSSATGVYLYKFAPFPEEIGNPIDPEVIYIGCSKSQGRRGMRSRQVDVIREITTKNLSSYKTFSKMYIQHFGYDIDQLYVSYSPQPHQVTLKYERMLINHYKHANNRLPLCQNQDVTCSINPENISTSPLNAKESITTPLH